VQAVDFVARDADDVVLAAAGVHVERAALGDFVAAWRAYVERIDWSPR